MSVEQLAVVLHHSNARGTDKLVLVGIANHAGDGGAWPAVATLARYANVKPRAVQSSLARLVESGELRRYVQAGGLQGWADYTRPNRYDVLVECPEWCDRSAQHKPREGWAYDDDGNVVRVEQLDDQPGLSTGDTPEMQNHATRRDDPVSQTTPPVVDDTPRVSQTTPKPSTNQPDPADLPASTTDREAAPTLDELRAQLRDTTAQHHRRERGEA